MNNTTADNFVDNDSSQLPSVGYGMEKAKCLCGGYWFWMKMMWLSECDMLTAWVERRINERR